MKAKLCFNGETSPYPNQSREEMWFAPQAVSQYETSPYPIQSRDEIRFDPQPGNQSAPFSGLKEGRSRRSCPLTWLSIASSTHPFHLIRATISVQTGGKDLCCIKILE